MRSPVTIQMWKSFSTCNPSMLLAWSGLNINGASSAGSLIHARKFSRTTTFQAADKVEVSVKDGIRNIVINRPEARNALSFEVTRT